LREKTVPFDVRQVGKLQVRQNLPPLRNACSFAAFRKDVIGTARLDLIVDGVGKLEEIVNSVAIVVVIELGSTETGGVRLYIPILKGQ
jgi:hypothetical protein